MLWQSTSKHLIESVGPLRRHAIPEHDTDYGMVGITRVVLVVPKQHQKQFLLAESTHNLSRILNKATITLLMLYITNG